MATLKAIFALSLIFVASHASAQSLQNEDYPSWLQTIEQDAIADGVSYQTAHMALDSVLPNDRVIELDHRQPEKTLTLQEYLHNVVTADRIEEGRELLREHETELDAIADRYGVQPQVIIALWGIESSFGQQIGNFNIVESLVSLAYEGRRADLFRKELIAALHIIDQEHIRPDALRGSWAGAMGQCQFMPSTYLRYAVDANGDGRRDIWSDRRDVWASIANYLAAEGWKDNLNWGREVQLSRRIRADDIGLDQQYSLLEWADMGVLAANGSDLPQQDVAASLIQPDGAGGRSFLVYDNFRALMRWNHSTYFATAVGILADRIKR